MATAVKWLRAFGCRNAPASGACASLQSLFSVSLCKYDLRVQAVQFWLVMLRKCLDASVRLLEVMCCLRGLEPACVLVLMFLNVLVLFVCANENAILVTTTAFCTILYHYKRIVRSRRS
jgi:hypothetical protein